jgi:putative FmdB family regulatory protein
MPAYEYRCTACGKLHEIVHGFHDQRPTQCPACGGPLVRVFHPVGVVFKGSGFHKTDYAAKQSEGAASSDATPKETKKPAEAPAKTSSPAPTPPANTTKKGDAP